MASNIIRECWLHDPEVRPTAVEVSHILEEYLTQSEDDGLTYTATDDLYSTPESYLSEPVVKLSPSLNSSQIWNLVPLMSLLNLRITLANMHFYQNQLTPSFLSMKHYHSQWLHRNLPNSYIYLMVAQHLCNSHCIHHHKLMLCIQG